MIMGLPNNIADAIIIFFVYSSWSHVLLKVLLKIDYISVRQVIYMLKFFAFK
jgi:hypothetical protein